MKQRICTVEQKMEVLRYAIANGMVAAYRQFDIAQRLYFRWKGNFDRQAFKNGLYSAFQGQAVTVCLTSLASVENKQPH